MDDRKPIIAYASTITEENSNRIKFILTERNQRDGNKTFLKPGFYVDDLYGFGRVY